MTDITKQSLRDLRKTLDKKEIGVKELTAEYLKRIKKINPGLSALITITEEEAYKNSDKAQEVINSERSNTLTGIPAVLNDDICTDGIRTTCASKMLEDFVPPYDASVVEQLKENNYVLLGKSALDEFAMGCTGQTNAILKTKNPYDFKYVPGSSGGSAAAVSMSLCGFALASEISAAAFCGVTAIKPTYGRVSRHGLVAYASSFDRVGAFANNAFDCGTVLNAISAHDSRDCNCANPKKFPRIDFTSKIGESINGLRIAVPKEYFGDGVTDEVKTAVMEAAYKYTKKGAVLVECSIKSLKYAAAAYYLIASAEASSNLAKFDGVKFGLKGNGRSFDEQIRDSRNRGFGEEVKKRILLGNFALSSNYYDDYFKKAMAIRQEIVREYNEIFEKADIIIAPTAPCTAYETDSQNAVQNYTNDILRASTDIAGLPVVSTTCAYNASGMPIGMSLIGKKFDEAVIIKAADNFEAEFEKISPEINGN